MKKFKWPWPFKKKVPQVKFPPIDLSDFADDLDPFAERVKDVRVAYDFLKERYHKAHKIFWEKVAEILGYELPGDWQYNYNTYTLIYKGGANEEEALPEVQAPSEYEVYWSKLQATFYERG